VKTFRSHWTDFIIASLALYAFGMMVYAVWSYLTFVGLDKMEWVGSLIYLPHGVRVMAICYFGYKSIPALYAVEITGPIMVYPEQYFDVWPFASVASLLSVVAACEIVKWSNSNVKGTIFMPLNFTNYRSLVLVIVLSGLMNAISANLVTSLLADIDLSVRVIARFFVGDVLGSFVLILFLSALFTTLRVNRLLVQDK